MTYRQDHKDIDFLIDELEKAQVNLGDAKRLRDFISRHGRRISELLSELKGGRDEDERRHIQHIEKNTKRIIVEGYSEENIHEAFSDALGKITHYFSEHNDVSVNVLGLMRLPKGGHRATLEVILTPIKMSQTEQREGPTVELKCKEGYSKRKKDEDEHLKHLVHDHFLAISGYTPDIPDHFLININEADILNMMIEKQFFSATTEPEAPSPAPSKVVVRVLRPDGDDTKSS